MIPAFRLSSKGKEMTIHQLLQTEIIDFWFEKRFGGNMPLFLVYF
jgi:hypothetical protein